MGTETEIHKNIDNQRSDSIIVRIHRYGHRVIWTFPLLSMPFRRRAISGLVRHSDYVEAVPYLITALKANDQIVSRKAGKALQTLQSPDAVDALCGLWSKCREPVLGELVASCRYHARSPVDVRVLSGLKSGYTEVLSREGSEAVSWIVKALDDKDASIKANAEKTLQTLQSLDAVDALIDRVLEGTHPDQIIRIIHQQKYKHSVEGRFLLYLVVVGRFDEYLDLDFEFQVLRPEFHAAPAGLQDRIRQSILRHGVTRMNVLFVSERKDKILGELTEQDADVLVKINVRNRNWDDLFKYFWVLPARHIAQSVQEMQKAGWRPDDPDRSALFDKLSHLVQQIKSVPDHVGMQTGPIIGKWITDGERDAFASQPENTLRKMLKETTPPSQTISAGYSRERMKPHTYTPRHAGIFPDRRIGSRPVIIKVTRIYALRPPGEGTGMMVKAMDCGYLTKAIRTYTPRHSWRGAGGICANLRIDKVMCSGVSLTIEGAQAWKRRRGD